MNKKKPISNQNKRISQLKERKHQVEQMTKEKERRKRANRLIQTGALVEKYFKCEHLLMEEREELFKMFADYVNNNKPKKFKE